MPSRVQLGALFLWLHCCHLRSGPQLRSRSLQEVTATLNLLHLLSRVHSTRSLRLTEQSYSGHCSHASRSVYRRTRSCLGSIAWLQHPLRALHQPEPSRTLVLLVVETLAQSQDTSSNIFLISSNLPSCPLLPMLLEQPFEVSVPPGLVTPVPAATRYGAGRASTTASPATPPS